MSPIAASTGGFPCGDARRHRYHAGFTKGAIYSTFKSRDDLFPALVADRIEPPFAVVEEVLETSGPDAADLLPG